MNKRYFTLFFLLLFVGFAAVSQDLKITKIEASRLKTALIDRVTDPISGEECAVLHIKTEGLTPEERDRLDFELDQASTIAKTLKDGGEILMYVPPRTVLLVVKSPFGNYRADFRRDFGFKDGTVERTDYDVYIEYNRPAPVPDPEADMGGQYFVLTVSPATANVYVDGDLRTTTNGELTIMLPYGEHKYRIEAPSFIGDEGTFTIGKTKVTKTVTLVSAQAQLTLSCGDAAGNKTFTVNGVSFEMIAVKGGTFTMGASSGDSYADDREKPAHSVTLSDYYIGKFEVTQELWEAVMGSNPSYFKGSKLPVESVSWDDCQTFIRKLNSLTGKNFRLPTEAEWEYAARAGSEKSLYGNENIVVNGKNNSPNLDRYGWYGGNCGQHYTASEGCDESRGYDISGWEAKQYGDERGGTHPVGRKTPNAWGIYDILGNVWEWCQDWYGDYGSSSQTNPQGPSSGSSRVLRGGCWYIFARDCRVSLRGDGTPDYRGNYIGFRLVLVP